MPSIKITSTIEKNTVAKRYSATVLNVLGKYLSVQLQGNGSVLKRISYIGATPSKGDTVTIDYSGVQPVAQIS